MISLQISDLQIPVTVTGPPRSNEVKNRNVLSSFAQVRLR